jgi:hypothetical protein
MTSYPCFIKITKSTVQELLKDTLYERFGLHSQNPYDQTSRIAWPCAGRHWYDKVITSKQQVTALKSAHKVFIV